MALWIGLEEENMSGNGLVQGGLFHDRDGQGTPHMCKFYEKYPAQSAHLYDCGDFNGGAYYSFIVKKYNTPSGKMVEVLDCGEWDSDPYGTCVTELSGISDNYILYDHAIASAEETHKYCQDTMFGNSTSPANIGSSSKPIEVEHDSGDPWIDTETFDGVPQDGAYTCDHFHKDLPNPQTLVVWDDRNVD
ncbi:MAG TPA: hypothetical protein VH419_06980 [Nocardioidaceae bacterium]